MRELTGVNIWDFHEQGEWIAITTNADLRANGHLVMGNNKPGTGGIAGDAARRYPDLARFWGYSVKTYGNTPAPYWLHKMISFPTKNHWRDDSDLDLIEESAIMLMRFLEMNTEVKVVYLPQPGTGLGKLKWADVKARIAPILDDRVIVVSR